MPGQSGTLESLDQSSFSLEHARIYSIGTLGHICDGFTINIMGYVLPAIIVAFHLTAASAGFLASAAFVGMLFGAGGGGALADKIGRKRTMVASLVVFCVGSFACVAAPTYWTFWVARLVSGIGLGAEIALIFPYLVEFLPVRTRGGFSSATSFMWMMSSLIAAGFAVFVIPEYGWRGMFAIAGVIGLVTAAAWLTFPESIRFLIENNRLGEAQAIMSRLGGARAAAGRVDAAVRREPMAAEQRQPRAPLSMLMGRDYSRQTVCVWAMQFLTNFVFFGIAVWLPELFIRMGFSFVHSMLFTGLVTASGACGNILSGFVMDRWGRRPTLVFFLFVGGLALAFWGHGRSEATILAAGMVATFFSFGAIGPMFTYTSEIYPTTVRGAGVGIAIAWGRLGGIVAPYVLGLFVGSSVPASWIFAFLGALMFIAGVVVWWLAIETMGESLEGIQNKLARGGRI